MIDYTTESLQTDINWLSGYGVDEKEAEDFIRSLLNKTLIE